MNPADEPVCDLLRGHEGPVRFYPSGWRCSAHSPWREKDQPEPPPGLIPRARLAQPPD
ncbi:hypothetical protein ACFVHR_04615 [Streptomyces sp. NPDC127168]|uniref:hypothetical protein n=1 Tax=unclassified Streptomyces TaxID=2593676 RepID=UPI003625DD9B